GCATYTQRHAAVAPVISEYLRPLLIGRDPQRIEELWRLMHVNGYWRNGPVVNNAISGVDMALWDIKGKLADMPVYDLLGGKCREAAAIYQHAAGCDPQQLLDSVQTLLDTGVRHCRIQLADNPHTSSDKLHPQTAGYGGLDYTGTKPQGALEGHYYSPGQYTRMTLKALAYLRSELDDTVELIHDVHERLDPIDAVAFARDV